MSSLVGAPPARLGDVDPGRRAPGEDEEGGPERADDEASLNAGGGLTPPAAPGNAAPARPTEERMLALLEQQSSAMSQMMAMPHRPHQAPTGELDLLMGTGRDDLEAAGGISGARGCAARELWRAKLLTPHDRSAAAVKAKLAQALSKSASSLDPRAMHEFMEKICPLGQYKMLTYTAFLVAELWRLTEENNMEGLRSLAARAAIFVDQTATEGGRSYQLAWLLTGLEEPPFATTEARVARGGVQYAHSRLADPAAVATNLAFLRDMDLV